MIKIINGKYDINYFDNMTIDQLKIYLKKFSSHDEFLKKEKLFFVPKEVFNNWLFTIHFMDVDVDKFKAPYNFFSSSITIENIKYDYPIVKNLMKNYQFYFEHEYFRILKEFKELVIKFNN